MPTLDIPSAHDPQEALAAVVALRRLADQLERAATAEAMEQGWSWSQVGRGIGHQQAGGAQAPVPYISERG